MKKEKNSFDTLVEMFKDLGADCIFLSNLDGKIVTGEPANSITGDMWMMSMISSIDEALECKYPIAYAQDDKALSEYLEKNRGENGKKLT